MTEQGGQGEGFILFHFGPPEKDQPDETETDETGESE